MGIFLNVLLAVASFLLQLLLIPKPQNAKPASLEDFDFPTAEEGIEITVLFGTATLTAPNVTWYGDLQVLPIKGPRRYGFFGPRQVIGHKYKLGMQMGLCHGPADNVTKIRVGNDGEKVIFEGETTGGLISINKPELFGENQGGIVGDVDIEMGFPTQDQNDYLVSVLGAGVPAFRGVVTAVLRSVYLGNSTYIQPWDFKVQRIYLKSDGTEQWYPATAGIPRVPVDLDEFVPDPNEAIAGGSTSRTDWATSVAGDYIVILSSTGNLSCWKQPNFSTTEWTATDNAQGIAISSRGYAFTSYQTTQQVKVWNLETGALIATVPITGGGGNTAISCYDNEDGTVSAVVIGNLWSIVTGSGTSWAETGWADGANFLTATRGGSLGANYVYAQRGGLSVLDGDNRVYLMPRAGINPIGTGPLSTITLSEISSTDTIAGIRYDPTTGNVAVVTNGGFVHIYNEDLTEHLYSSSGTDGWHRSDTTPHSLSNGMLSANGIAFVVGNDGDNKRTIAQYDMTAQLVSYVFASDYDYVSSSPTDLQSSMVSVENNYMVTWGGSITNQVVWEIPPLASGELDMNPAHIIRECLTDKTWGMGYPEADIDDTVFTAAADALYSESFGLTFKWNREETIQEFVTVVISHIDAVVYISRSTGKFILKLIRNDYDIDELLVLTEDDIITWDEITRRQPPEAINSVVVKYTNTAEDGKDVSVGVHNIAQIQQLGRIASNYRQYPGITKNNLAVRVATRDLSGLGIGFISGKVTSKRIAEQLNPGDAFRMVSARHELSGEVFRVLDMGFGDGRNNSIAIKLSEDIFHLGDDVLVDEVQRDWENPSNPPAAATIRMAHELPWYEVRNLVGEAQANTSESTNPDFGFFVVAAGSPSADAINAAVSIDDGTGYETYPEQMEFSPTALLDAALAIDAVTVAIREVDDIDNISIGTLGKIEDEIVRVDAISATSITIGRGCLDTIPAAHTIDTPIIFYEDFGLSDNLTYDDADSVDVKVLPTTSQGTLASGLAPIDTIEFNSRAVRPLRPANVQVEGDGYGPFDGTALTDLTVTWAERNRLTETSPLDWLDATVTPEAGQTTIIEVLDPTGTSVVTTHSGLTGTTFEVPIASFGGNTSGFIKVGSERDGYREWNAHQIEVLVSGEFLELDGEELILDGETLYLG